MTPRTSASCSKRPQRFRLTSMMRRRRSSPFTSRSNL
jgi:hypothetical protein